MVAINTRSSVLAVTVETTEGVPVVPSASTEFVAQQDDFSMSPAFEQLENAELKNSLGKAKGIVGAETPTASFSHYLRSSNVVGTAPNYGEILKAIFGTETVASTEYNTIAASTTSVIKVDAGEGVNFQRGNFLMIKDGTNGYAIRPVHSISTDDLSLGFNLQTAPGVGVDLGQDVLYSPANSGHQTLNLWEYIGNAGNIQLMAGARPVSMAIDITAGQLINANYSFEGIGYYQLPLTTTATEYQVRFTDDDLTDEVIQVTIQTWKDPYQLADAIAIAMNATATTETHTVTYSGSTGKFTFTNTTGAVLELDFAGGTNQLAAVIGFPISDNVGATTYTGNAIDFSSPVTPTYDDADPLVAKNNVFFVGNQDDNVCFEPSSVQVNMGTPKRNIESICAESGISGSLINAREIVTSVTALLNQYEADFFRRMRENTETRAFYAGGEKSGGNWIAGRCFGIYKPNTTISNIAISDNDGLAELSFDLTTYVDADGNGEFYLGFV